MQVTRNQIGIILVVIGTALLAFSVKPKRQYEGAVGKAVDDLKRRKPDMLEPE